MVKISFQKLLQLVAMCGVLLMQQAIAEGRSSEIDTLMAANKWRPAARDIFLEARAADKQESAVIVGQAKGGFINDALDTISGTHPYDWSWHFLSLAQNAAAISPEKRNELVQRSLEAARNEARGDYVRSYSLIKIALYHSKSGADGEARAIFAEALAAAEKGLTEKGSGGFGNITRAMKDEAPDAVRDWMLAPLKVSLGKTFEAEPQAFSCIDMVSVAGRLGKPEQASPFIECAKTAIGRANKSLQRTAANERLADAAQDFGLNYSGTTVSPYGEAIREARSGNAKKSYDIVTSLSANLYVDHKIGAYGAVLSDAIKRNDLKTAHFFAEHALRKGVSQEVEVWQKIAEKEIQLGDLKSAGESYARAASALNSGDSRYYVADVLVFLQLGESMLRNGLTNEGRRVILLTLPLFEGTSDKRREDDLVRATVAVAESLWRIGMQAEAKKFLRQAYRLASSYEVSKRSYSGAEKARFLAAVGSVAVTFSSVNFQNKSVKYKK
jgi:tetratricopeptide (TPR) repeat protein